MRSLGYQNRTTSLTIGPRSRKIQALAMMLVLCLVTFVVLAGGEAWAAEQPSQAAQPGTVQSTTMINGKVAEPVAEVTPPVKTPPVETPPAQTPPPPTNETPPTEEPSPPPPKNETPRAEEPSPPPVDPPPPTPEPEPAPQPTPQPTPQWFAVVITDGEVVESEPVSTSQSVADFGQVLEPKPISNASPDVVDPTPTPAAPAAADDGYASGPAPDPVLPVPGPAAASEHVIPAASGLAGLVRGLVAEPAAPPAAAPRGDGSLRPTPADANPAAGLTPSAPVQTVPASVGGALRLPSSLGTTAARATVTVQSAATSAATLASEVLGSLTGGSPVNSSTNSTDGTQEQQPSEGTPQPAPPLAPVGGGQFSLSTTGGGGLAGPGGGLAPVLVGILALLATILLGRDFRTYLISCDMLKPSSALLLPLERPG